MLSCQSFICDEVIELSFILSRDHELVNFISLVCFQIRVNAECGAVAEPLGDVSCPQSACCLLHGFRRVRICLVIIDEILGGREVEGLGSWATGLVCLLGGLAAGTLKLDWDFVETPEKLKIHIEVFEHTKVARLE